MDEMTIEGGQGGGGWGRARVISARVAAWVGMLGLLLLTGATWIGVSGGMAERFLASVNRGDWFCEVSRLTLDLRGGIVAHHPRVYRKGYAGPPCLEADRIGVRYALFETDRGGRSRIRHITVTRGVVRTPAGMKGGGAGRSGGVGWGAGGEAATEELVLRLEDVDLMGVSVRRAQARVKLEPTAVAFQDMTVVVGDDLHSGTLHGDVVRGADGSIHGRLETRLDPRAMHPFLREAGVDLSGVFDRFSFHAEPPAIEMTLDIPAGSDRLGVLEGRFQASGFAYQGAAVGFANITWKHEQGGGRHCLVLSPMVLVMAGRSVTGGITIDLAQGWVDGEALSTVEFPTLARLIGLPAGWIPEAWTVGSQERVYAKGRYAYEDKALTALEVVAEGRDLAAGRFRADEVSLKWLMRGVTNELVDIRGRLAGGSFTAGATFVPKGGDASALRYTLKGEILHAELCDLIGMFKPGVVTGVQGKVYGNIDLEGVTGVASNAVGRGEVTIRRGRLFSIPLFGGLTQALSARFSGVDMLLLQKDAHATFEVRNNSVKSHDIRLDGDVFAVEADGEYGLGGTLGFVVKVRPAADGKLIGSAVRALTFPLSKLMEFNLEGTLANPRWKSAALSWPGWLDGNSKKAKGQ